MVQPADELVSVYPTHAAPTHRAAQTPFVPRPVAIESPPNRRTVRIAGDPAVSFDGGHHSHATGVAEAAATVCQRVARNAEIPNRDREPCDRDLVENSSPHNCYLFARDDSTIAPPRQFAFACPIEVASEKLCPRGTPRLLAIAAALFRLR
jgi:hypothetical protein